MKACLKLPDGLQAVERALARQGLTPAEPEAGLVLSWEPPQEWPAVEQALAETFRLTRRAAAAGAPVVYLVRQEDLRGWRGAPAAMLATGLVSGARALAMEGRRSGLTANVVAYGQDADPESVATWIVWLLRGAGVSGQVVEVGGGHLGKVVP